MTEVKDCGCIDKVNKALVEKNTQLNCGVMFPSGKTKLLVDTVKINPKSRQRKFLVTCNFCPFCGREFP